MIGDALVSCLRYSAYRPMCVAKQRGRPLFILCLHCDTPRRFV